MSGWLSCLVFMKWLVAPNYDSLMALAMSPDAFVSCTRSVVTSVSMLDFVDIQQYICSNMLAFSLLEFQFSLLGSG